MSVAADPVSFGELANVTQRRVRIKSTDMDKAMQLAAVRMCSEAMDKSEDIEHVATTLKRNFDQNYPAPWQCVVGRKFGSFVSHQAGYFIYFHMAHNAVLLFKPKD